MKKFTYIVILLIATIFTVDRCTRESIRPRTYVGEGKLRYFKPDFINQLIGWGCGFFTITFDEFPLSSEFKHTYKFSGLTPINEHLNLYEASLDVPPSIHRDVIEQGTLQMTLYADGNIIRSFQSTIKDLHSLDYKDFDFHEEEGDGFDKYYSNEDFKIPADKNVNYKLEVHYIPPENVSEKIFGHIRLSIGGGE